MNESETTERPAEPETAVTEPAVAEPEAVEPVAEPAVAEPAVAEPEAVGGLTLYFLRHGDAGDPMTWTGDDADRPLSRKGRRQAKRLGRHLKDLEVRPDSILTSPKLRSVETAKIVGRAIGRKPSTDDRLSFDFGSQAMTSLVSGLDADVSSLMVVGHDPDFSDAVSWLVGASINMRKGALAVVELPGRVVGAGRGSLRWLLPPDAIRG